MTTTSETQRSDTHSEPRHRHQQLLAALQELRDLRNGEAWGSANYVELDYKYGLMHRS